MTDPLHARAYEIVARQIETDAQLEVRALLRDVTNLAAEWERDKQVSGGDVGRIARTAAGLAVIAGKLAAHRELRYLITGTPDEATG